MVNTHPELLALVNNFVARIVPLVEANLSRRIQMALSGAMYQPVSQRALGATAAVPASETNEKPARRRPARLSPKLIRARKLQGQYLGAMRALKPAERSRVKAVAAEQGVAAGLKLALSLRE